MTVQQFPARTARHAAPISTADRWKAAAARATAEGIEVRQLAGSGGWIATSGSERGTAYELGVTGSVAHDCACVAAAHGDPVCKHRAAFYLAVGALEAARPAVCPTCLGTRIDNIEVDDETFAVAVCPTCVPRRRRAA